MKNRLLYAVAAVMIVMATMFAVACHKEDEENGGNGNVEITINPEYVPIDWTTTHLVSSNDSTGVYQIQFNGSVPDIHPGSILAIDKDTMVYYIFVKTVSVNGNTVSLTSIKAYLTDIFFNTDITLSTLPEGKSTARGAVFYPTKVYEVDENGVLQTVYWRSPGGSKTEIDTAILNVPSDVANWDGINILQNGNTHIYMDKCNFALGLNLVMYMNFGGSTVREVIGEALERYRSEALNINAKIVGSVETEQVLRCDAEGSYNFEPGYEIVRHDWLEKYIAFTVGPVPVVIQLNSDLYREVRGSINGSISAYAGFRDRIDCDLGFEWQQGQGLNPVFNTTNTFELIGPTVEGHGTIQAKAWFFPRFRVMLYGTLGPSFDIKPYCEDIISGGFREEMGGQENDYIGWTLHTHAGLDACCGLSLQFIGYEIENLSTDDRNLVDVPLFKSPYRVVHTSGYYAPEQSHLMGFTVYDTNYVLHLAQPTILPQVVKFQANGMISTEYATTHSGVVNVAWTPANNDILYALMYDPHGNIVAYDTVHAGDIHADDWVDLGLPSGTLWAKRNIGSILPEDRGTYFAWGETEPKSEYTWENYLYGGWNDLTKYCTDPNSGHNGYTDNLTVLLPEDDAATANWGIGARTPTKEEWEELFSNTVNYRSSLNGMPGWVFEGNGNSIFMPSNYGDENDGDRYHVYWTSTLCTGEIGDAPNYAYAAWMYFYVLGSTGIPEFMRKDALPVRAVRSPSTE